MKIEDLLKNYHLKRIEINIHQQQLVSEIPRVGSLQRSVSNEMERNLC